MLRCLIALTCQSPVGRELALEPAVVSNLTNASQAQGTDDPEHGCHHHNSDFDREVDPGLVFSVWWFLEKKIDAFLGSTDETICLFKAAPVHSQMAQITLHAFL